MKLDVLNDLRLALELIEREPTHPAIKALILHAQQDAVRVRSDEAAKSPSCYDGETMPIGYEARIFATTAISGLLHIQLECYDDMEEQYVCHTAKVAITQENLAWLISGTEQMRRLFDDLQNDRRKEAL